MSVPVRKNIFLDAGKRIFFFLLLLSKIITSLYSPGFILALKRLYSWVRDNPGMYIYKAPNTITFVFSLSNLRISFFFFSFLIAVSEEEIYWSDCSLSSAALTAVMISEIRLKQD